MYIHTPKDHPVHMYMANSKNDYLSHEETRYDKNESELVWYNGGGRFQ